MGTQRLLMKAVLPWLIRRARCVSARDFCPALAALVGPVQHIFFFTVHYLKGQCHEIFFASGSFHESVSPQPQSSPLRPFRIFSKIRGDIRSSRFATGVNDTGGKW